MGKSFNLLAFVGQLGRRQSGSASTDPGPAPGTAEPAKWLAHPLLWILVAGVVVRVLLLLWFQDLPLEVWDEREYNELAVNLATRGEFVLEGQASSMRPPLYPAVVAGVYKLCGAENYQAVRVLQALIGLATVAVVYLLGSEVYDRRVGAWAAGFFCFYPSMLGQANLLLSETLFTFWLVLICLVVVRFFRGNSIEHLVLSGVLIGLAALTRSVVWLLPPVLALYVVLVWRVGMLRRLTAALLMLLAFAITVAPWSIRSTQLEKTFVVIDVMGGRNLMMGNYDHTPTYRAWDAISVEGEKSWYRVLARENPDFRHLTQGQRDKLAMRYGLRYMATHPAQTLLRDVVKFFNFWQLERSLVAGMGQGLFGNPSVPVIVLLTALIFASYAAAMGSGVFGAVLAGPEDRRIHGFLLLLIAFVCGLHTLVFAHSRYHLPLMPLVLVFSAAGWINVREIWGRRATWPFWLAAGLCLLLIGGWTWEIAVVDFQRFMSILAPGS